VGASGSASQSEQLGLGGLGGLGGDVIAPRDRSQDDNVNNNQQQAQTNPPPPGQQQAQQAAAPQQAQPPAFAADQPNGLFFAQPAAYAPTGGGGGGYPYGGGGYSYGGGGGGGGFRGGGGAAGGGGACFTADTRVRTHGGGLKRMDELEVGDWVLSADEKESVYSRVESWLHRVGDELALFHVLGLEDGRVLKATGKHFIYRLEARQCLGNGKVDFETALTQTPPVYVESVRVGDCLYTLDEDHSMRTGRVVNISTVVERGIYAPMTSNGVIFTEGVLASCYVVREERGFSSGASSR